MNNIWRKFIPCDCQNEGIMISYEYQNSKEALPLLDLAFFSNGFHGKYPLTIKAKIQWCWHIITKGEVFNDMVILNKENAEDLAKELLIFTKQEKTKRRN